MALGSPPKAERLYTQAKAFRSDTPRQRLRARGRFERSLLAVCAPFCGDQSAAQRVLCERVQRHLSELFVFVSDPKVPADNPPGADRGTQPASPGHRAEN